jgi:hypothetical protein
MEVALLRIATYPRSRSDELTIEQARAIARETIAYVNQQTTEPRRAWGEYVPGIGWMAATAYGRSGSYETEAEALREAEARAAREDRMRERATGSAA